MCPSRIGDCVNHDARVFHVLIELPRGGQVGAASCSKFVTLVVALLAIAKSFLTA
jgi:hypothetical protein